MVNRALYTHISKRHSSSLPLSLGQLLRQKPQPALGKVEVAGWVRAARKQKKFTFFDLSDGSVGGGLHLQVVANSKDVEGQELAFHSCVRVSGEVVESSHQGQKVELRADKVEVLSSPQGKEYPFQPHHPVGEAVRREGAHTCKAKVEPVASILRIRAALAQHLHTWLTERDFLQVDTPILTGNDCEGGGDVFTVSAPSPSPPSPSSPYWGHPVHLTVSAQLHLEALCNGLPRVYTLGPAFRAERGRTRRHLSEFHMLEAEVAFISSVPPLVSLIQELLTSCATLLLQSEGLRADLDAYWAGTGSPSTLGRLEALVSSPLTLLSHREAVALVTSAPSHSHLPLLGERGDLAREHELYLCQRLGGLVGVTDWPQELKPSYVRGVEGEGNLVSALDILVPQVGELVGGSLREHDPDILEAKLRARGEEMPWYVNLRRQGAAPTAGFGLGFERLLQYLVGIENIKDTIPFYRTPHSCIM